VGHLAYKESNRLQALCDNLQGIGIQCRVIHGEEIVLLVEPDRPWAQQLQVEHRPEMGLFRSYGDHRMVMAMSMLAMPGWDIALDDARVVAKSYPTFWEHWRALGYELED
jgi:3-phosphoshikimate 1-carboxyvinyltransferase